MVTTDLGGREITLLMPPAAQTEESIALVWHKPQCEWSIKHYNIYKDYKLCGSTTHTDYTLCGLEPGHKYEVQVEALIDSYEETLKSQVLEVETKQKSTVMDITHFGAIGDGKTVNTRAIQAAIDACPIKGKVFIPRGIFISGALHLKSEMTLYIEEGAVLKGSSQIEDFPIAQYRFEGLETSCYTSLINVGVLDSERRHHITIEGLGTIDANGSLLRAKELKDLQGKPGRAVCLNRVNYVYIKDVTIRHSPAWCVHLIYCNHITLNHIAIHTKYDEEGNKYEGIANGDGFDPDSCKDVYLFNSLISSQDDCVAIKSGRDAEGRAVGVPTEQVRITNCQFTSGFGVAIGSEMAAGVRDVLVQDCQFENVYSVGSIKAPRGRGGIVERIIYEDITHVNNSHEHVDCEWFRGAIYIDQYYSHKIFDVNEIQSVGAGTPKIRDITFRNICTKTCAGNAIYITGLWESPIESVYLENVQAIGKEGMIVHHVQDLRLNQVSANKYEENRA